MASNKPSLTLRELYVNFPYKLWKYEPIPPQPVKIVTMKVIDGGMGLFVSALVKSATRSGINHRTTIVLWRKNKSEYWNWDMRCQVKCSCESFHYYLAYAIGTRRSLVGRPSYWNRVPAVVMNPSNKVQACKHIILLSNTLFRKKIVKGRILWKH